MVASSARRSLTAGRVRSVAAAPPGAALADNGAVATYVHFARFYDALMDDPLGNGARIRGYLDRHMPDAGSLLELGCGSGSILAGMPAALSLTGLDRSPQMLDAARAKVPAARLIEADMRTFALGERFDAVICVFDTLNHVERFEDWRRVFERAATHLRDGGLFAFDVNTIGQLRRLGAAGPWTRDLAGVRITQDVECHADGRSTWHVWIDELLDDGRRIRHHERIAELGVPLTAIAGALAGTFTILECSDDDSGTPDDGSVRAYFLCRRLPRSGGERFGP